MDIDNQVNKTSYDCAFLHYPLCHVLIDSRDGFILSSEPFAPSL